MDEIKTTDAVQHAGEAVQGHAARIQELGDNMYQQVRNLLSNEQLSGAIGQALEQSQDRWDAACRDFADKEQQFGVRTVDSHINLLAADTKGSGYF